MLLKFVSLALYHLNRLLAPLETRLVLFAQWFVEDFIGLCWHADENLNEPIVREYTYLDEAGDFVADEYKVYHQYKCKKCGRVREERI